MTGPYTDVAKKIAPGVLGAAQVVHDEPDKFTILRVAIQGMPLSNRTYVRLIVNGILMMTDAEFERRTNTEVLHRAKGNALIAGLGIGLILDPVAAKCDSVTVVEKSRDVIALVGPSFPNISIVNDDIFKFKTKAKYDTIYFDIWPDINPDDLNEAATLHRLFRKNLKRGGYMQSWTCIANKGRRSR